MTNGDYHFKNPYGIAVYTSGNVFVVDSGNNRIQKFRPTSLTSQNITDAHYQDLNNQIPKETPQENTVPHVERNVKNGFDVKSEISLNMPSNPFTLAGRGRELSSVNLLDLTHSIPVKEILLINTLNGVKKSIDSMIAWLLKVKSGIMIITETTSGMDRVTNPLHSEYPAGIQCPATGPCLHPKCSLKFQSFSTKE